MVRVYRTYTIEKDIAEKAERLAKEWGFNMSATINLLLEQWGNNVEELMELKKKNERETKK